MTHRLQCQCGTRQGEIDEPMRGLHIVCYCGDCQAYVATQSRYLRFTSGTQALACLSLSPKGLLRWEGAFPGVQMQFGTERAKGEPPKLSAARGMGRLAVLMLRLLGSRLGSGYKATPFFDANRVPVAEVVVAQREAVEKARAA